METGSASLIARRVLSIAFTVLILGFIFMIHVLIEKEKETRIKSYPFIVCNNLQTPPTKSESIEDYQLELGEK